MDKNKKLVIGAVVILIVLIIAIIILKININNDDKNASDMVTTVVGQVQEKNVSDNEYVTLPEQTEETKVSETNYFDNMSIYEETSKKAKKKNKKDKKNKNQETEAYPGENDGWSPIVSPDDLEQ